MIGPVKRGSPPFFEAQYRAVCLEMGGITIISMSVCAAFGLANSLKIFLKTPFFDQRKKRL